MRRLRALPQIRDRDITTLRREYRKLKDKRKDTSVIHRILVLATARRIRREIKAENQGVNA